MINYAGKKVLVTGGGGFIPSHVVRRLVELGADVTITTKYDSIVDNVRIADLWDRIRVMEADLRNLDALMRIRDVAPEIVFHMAAYNHVGDSFWNVAEAMESNASGTANLFQAYDDFERFVYISTSEVYGYQTEVPFREDMIPHPVSPYSVGKYSGELYAQMLARDMGRPVAIVRPFNTFGPYQSMRAVIPELIVKCLRGEDILSTEGKQTREFNFVSNIVDGIVEAGRNPAAVGEIINLGAGEEIAIRDLIHAVHRETGSNSELKIGALENRPTEIWRMRADADKANRLLGWSPTVSFEDGLKQAIEWYREFLEEFYGTDSRLIGLATKLARDPV